MPEVIKKRGLSPLFLAVSDGYAVDGAGGSFGLNMK